VLSRLASLRVWLIAAMLATAVLTLAAGNLISERLSVATEDAADQAKATATAQAIAAQVRGGADAEDLRSLQRVLPNEQIIVIRNGARIFSGPPLSSDPLEFSVSVPVPGGRVELLDHHAPASAGVAQGTLVAAGIATVIIIEAWLAATLLLRAVRRPVGRAIEAAGRLADGDLSARVGDSGLEEFARLGRAVDTMAARLQDADTTQRRFLADLAHEIATPVSAISGFAIALADGSATSPAERAEAADVVTHESDRLHRLLDDVRQLTRLEMTASVRNEHIDLHVVCAETARRFRRAASDAGIAVTVSAAHVWLEADPRLIDAVINNFVSNAIRYTPPGGTVHIRAGRRRRQPAAVIAVRDTGTGIAPEHLKRIFDRLYRTDAARDRATGGSGLGLAIARSAAQTLGARIEVSSEPGVGSEFRLVLVTAANQPVTAGPAASAAGPVPPGG
jgi:two-component system sensor histidine kinase BaeS